MRRLHPETFALTALLGTLAGLQPLSVDIYLPSMPDIAHTLGTTTAEVQLTIAAFLFGSGVGTIVFGPFADRHGRRTILLISLLLFCAGTLLCAIAPTIEALIAGRALQALGPSGTAVIARALVRDLYEGPRVGREFAVMGAVMAVAPLVAPIIGGVVQTAAGWRAVFLVLLAVGVVTTAIVWTMLPETLRTRAPERVSVIGLARVYREMLRNPAYVSNVAILSTGACGLLAWISGAAQVLQDQTGLEPMEFGLMFVVSTCGFLVGNGVSARLAPRIGIDRTLGIGAAVLTVSSIVMVIDVITGFGGVLGIVVPMSFYLAGMGAVFPQSQAAAMMPFRHRAGAASSLAGFSQQLAGAAVGIATSIAMHGAVTALPLALIIAGAGSITLVLWVTTRRVRLAGIDG
jgi:DHA1 family bicyclomycin/chloramphenicol resistance-like MFS transporter